MGNDGGSAVLSVLTRRGRFLEALLEGPVRKDDLAKRLGVSRSTVDRAICDLERFDLVACADCRCRLTLAGELALAEYEEFLDRVTVIADASDVLSALPPTVPLERAFVDGATVVRVGDDPSRSILEAQLTGTHQRVFVTETVSHLVAASLDAIDDGLECEFVFTSETLDDLATEFRGPVSAALAAGRVELREATTTLPYSLVLSRHDPTGRVVASLVVTSDDGLEAIVSNDSEPAVAWAESTFASLWQQASPLSVLRE
ncbi:helix-turn-helix transcriptional regulator [Natronobiforma cellulositropha]|uniref:helix-turn-helix transcriptional regulator n=1 Tax=Natronobiforma cellulositropha TaxID=1679076 RepID=UPI0021D5B127|nr:HTH domain-containing protein [Natronobiforma cellulositropha]